MESGQMDLMIQRKRKREDDEICEGDEFELLLLLTSCVGAVVGAWYHSRYMEKKPLRTEFDEKYYKRKLWLRGLRCESTCIEQLRVTTQGFAKLCRILCDKGGLVATQNVTVTEIVALFLQTLAHNLKNRVTKAILGRSGETISRQFHSVLQAVIKIGKEYIRPHEDVLDEFDMEKWKWFQGALGALDGTHIPVTVALDEIV